MCRPVSDHRSLGVKQVLSRYKLQRRFFRSSALVFRRIFVLKEIRLPRHLLSSFLELVSRTHFIDWLLVHSFVLRNKRRWFGVTLGLRLVFSTHLVRYVIRHRYRIFTRPNNARMSIRCLQRRQRRLGRNELMLCIRVTITNGKECVII